MTNTLEQRLARDLHRMAAATTIPPLPTVESAAPEHRRRRTGRRRALIAAAAATAGLAVAVPVAAAAGALSAISVAFGWTHQPPLRGGLPIIAANDATGRHVLTVPGPPGETMQIWVADAVGGGQCVSLLEPAAGGGYHSLGGACSSAGSTPATVEFGAGGDYANGWITDLSAPGAAYVTLADGLTTRKIQVADGVSAAWLPPVDQNRHLTLTAYTAAGTVIGTTTGVAYPTPPTGQSGDPNGMHTSPGPPGLGS